MKKAKTDFYPPSTKKKKKKEKKKINSQTNYQIMIFQIVGRISKMIRSSHQRCSLRKSVLRNFVKFTGQCLCQSLFFNKVVGLSPATLEHLWWLLLNYLKSLHVLSINANHQYS